MRFTLRLVIRLLCTLLVTLAHTMFWAPASKAQDLVEQEKVKQIWQLLDYVAVDYRKAVVKGQIASDDEFAEMQEFSQSVHQQLASLPVKTAQMGLVRQAETLRQLIAKKSSPDAVADRARKRACKNFCVKRGHEIIPKGICHDRYDDHEKAAQKERTIPIPS